ncbi:MAG: hypothetical protein DCC48_04085 [Acidobacteria bacterium]|nr:MAG: hypothetical protein DCC48_04085 [Acidobacteriota bacterium]
MAADMTQSTHNAHLRAGTELNVSAPRPLLSQRAEVHLGPRHREILDELESLFLDEGFASFTVGELAAGVGCSRRTLYELAPSKDELVLIVLDRFLHRVGRSALASMDPDTSFAEQIRSYFLGGVELQRQTAVFAEDIADQPSAKRLLDRHFRYVMAVIEHLVRQGIDQGEFRTVSPAVVAAVLAGSGLYLSQPDVRGDLGLSRADATNEVLDLVLRSLTDPRDEDQLSS